MYKAIITRLLFVSTIALTIPGVKEISALGINNKYCFNQYLINKIEGDFQYVLKQKGQEEYEQKEESRNIYLVNSDLNKGIKVNNVKNISKFKAAKIIKQRKSVQTNNRWKIKLSKQEIDLLAKIVWVESRGECDLGQRAVVEVIFNRMIHGEFNGSLYNVLSSRGQFCSWGLKGSAMPTDKEYNNIRLVLSGNSNITSFDTVYFSTAPRNSRIECVIENHYFCRF